MFQFVLKNINARAELCAAALAADFATWARKLKTSGEQ